MSELKKCEVCRWIFDWPRNGDLYMISGVEHAICNGCADRISETRRFTYEFESARQAFSRALGIVAWRPNGEFYQWGVSWREGWEQGQNWVFQSMASQQSPLVLFKTFLRSLGRRRKYPCL